MAGSDQPLRPEGAASHNDETLQAASRNRWNLKCFRLQVTAGVDRGKLALSQSDRFVVGKAEGVDMSLHDPLVSRYHLELLPGPDGVVLRDLGSKNGTFIGSVRVREVVLVGPVTISLGQSEIRFDIEPRTAGVPVSERERFGSLVGASLAMRRATYLLERASEAKMTVLLTGESGTGKEEAARALHAASAAAAGPFVVVDCAAIPELFFESELFGHEKGAFAGADVAREGALVAARGGTVFLDEVGELPVDVQGKLLRAIERREIKRVGGDTYHPIDVRFIAASTRDLLADVNAKRFKPELYYRIATAVIAMPPLREREEDIPRLVDEFLRQIEANDGLWLSNEQRLSLLDEVRRRAFPGNVRELKSYVERFLLLGAGLPMLDEALSQTHGEHEAPESSSPHPGPVATERDRLSEKLERRYLELLLSRKGAASMSRHAGIERLYLQRLLRRHGLSRSR